MGFGVCGPQEYLIVVLWKAPLRGPPKSLGFWVRGVCLNQYNIPEADLKMIQLITPTKHAKAPLRCIFKILRGPKRLIPKYAEVMQSSSINSSTLLIWARAFE